MIKLSVTLAVYNEEKFLARCLDSIKDIADEIIIVDGGSTDKTVSIAKKYGAKVIETSNPPIFHINKQKALDAAMGEWVLLLDADELVSKELAREIMEVITLSDKQIQNRKGDGKLIQQFKDHLRVLEAHDGKIGTDSDKIVAFFVPRKNYFLGKFLTKGGVYPDFTIRLVKRGLGKFGLKSVHDQMKINGGVGLLEEDLLHYSNPTFADYIEKRFNRYTDLMAKDLRGGFVRNVIWSPLFDRNQGFFFIYVRHLGFLDGFPGYTWALFSALHFPIAYFKKLDLERLNKDEGRTR